MLCTYLNFARDLSLQIRTQMLPRICELLDQWETHNALDLHRRDKFQLIHVIKQNTPIIVKG